MFEIYGTEVYIDIDALGECYVCCIAKSDCQMDQMDIFTYRRTSILPMDRYTLTMD